MTETANRPGGMGQADQSTTDQAKERVQEAALQVQEKAVEVKGQAGDRVRRELESRSTEAGSQLGLTADAMRRTGDRLREEGNEAPAKIVTAVADRAERLGDYMTHTNADRLVRDVESFARRQPLLFAFGGATLGFLASRFVKASSDRRYEGGNEHGSFRPATQSAPGTNGEAAKVNRELGNGRSAGQGGEPVYSADPRPRETDEPASPATLESKRGGSSGTSGQ